MKKSKNYLRVVGGMLLLVSVFIMSIDVIGGFWLGLLSGLTTGIGVVLLLYGKIKFSN
ncbi:hypothetical protein [Tenacibaculum sp. 190524A02b]|uniref:Uncharacterized protein n=1 Tax=Tenacibaculum vairaonense TaxID=3137860 RepID=A0ABM9PH58_9FLAO